GGGSVVTGHRDGRLGFYDLETGAMLMCVDKAHRGHVTTLSNLGMGATGGGQGCFITGGQDGFVRVWDTRVGAGTVRAVMEVPAHRGPRGVGAVGGVIGIGGSAGVGIPGGVYRFASFGADKRICIMDLRRATAVEHIFEEHRDFIYCMDFVPTAADGSGGLGGGVLVTGGGDGMILVHDVARGAMRLLYGLGCCSAGAVRCVVAHGNRMLVGGDDGNAMMY
ncbi:unnamed protein product, partial [Sphacelaria rigidula]